MTNGQYVFDHILKSKEEGGLGYKNSDVFIFGRSIGTGPACHLASKYNPRGLILVSPYTSIKHVAANIAGKFLSLFMAHHFNNIGVIKKVNCPIIMIHGRKDDLILSTHSENLMKEFLESKQEGDPCLDESRLLIHPHMTHNHFDMDVDIIMPVGDFI